MLVKGRGKVHQLLTQNQYFAPSNRSENLVVNPLPYIGNYIGNLALENKGALRLELSHQGNEILYQVRT